MFKKTILNVLCFSIIITSAQSFADPVIIKNRQQYIVKQGDTLWDISNRFLAKPWYWKEIWKENPNIKDPNFIYPDDIISVEKIDGKEYLTLIRNSHLEEYQLTEEQYVKQEPQEKSETISDSIGLIDKNKIKNYFSNNIITDLSDNKIHGTVIKSSNGSLISGAGDEIFVVYAGIKPGQVFNIYSNVIEHKDKEQEDLVLGYEIVKIGEGLVTAVSEGDVGLMRVLSTKSGIRGKYKIMPKEDEDYSNMFPSKPVDNVIGNIISLGENIGNVGLYDVILINKGYSSNLEVGNILSIKNETTLIENPLKEDSNLKLPGQNIGLVMLYKVYDNLSYGVIVRAKAPIKKEHIVTNPE
jgi:hypothetical protein